MTAEEPVEFKAVEEALAGRRDLAMYGDNNRLLFAVQLRLEVDDIDGLAAEALTDGPDDKGLDLIHVDRDRGILLLAQGYESAKNRPSAPEWKASSLSHAVSWVISHTTDDVPERLAPKIEEARAALADAAIREIWVWYVHNLPETENNRRALQVVRSGIESAITARYPELRPDIRAEEIGRDTIAKWYESSRTPILVHDEIAVPVVGDQCLTAHGPGWTAHTVTVAAEWLNTIYWKYEEKLFSANVRGFLGTRRSKDNINNGMRETLESEPGNFWVFNNGITALVDSVQFDAERKELLIRGLSIVNGAQTTGTVSKFRDRGSLGDAQVTARFIECGDPVVVQKIIRYNNRQNAVDPADFRSNDREQRRLVEEFVGLKIDGYTGGRRGRGVDDVSRPSKAVDVESASRALAAYHGMPGIAYNGLRQVWEDDRIYRRLFSEQTSARHILFCWSLIRAVEGHKAHLRSLPQDQPIPKGKDEQREYFDHPGAIPLMVTAIAESIEAILDRGIANSFQLKFVGKQVPVTCVKNWRPIVEVLAPLAHKHLKPVLKPSGPPRELSSEALDNFRNQVESRVVIEEEPWATFTHKVTLKG